ncbi:MAG: 1-deoxy-D-xylulose-5-phosphate reductoisomerase, partial [Proteobacteria bacterium]|nr:1-deoxy-D-xylulose-5-phosphate reductoisomerase [Pseudomonadota bacterium]
AQMGLPDMRFPIQYALSYPEKYPNPWGKMTLSQLKSLEFYPPDHQRFPLLSFAIDCGKKGGTWPVVLNAANEELVSQFLAKKINFSKQKMKNAFNSNDSKQ